MKASPMPTTPCHQQGSSLKNRVFLAVFISAITLITIVGVWYVSDVLLVLFAGVLAAVFLRGLSSRLARITRMSEGWSLAIVSLVIVAAGALGFWLLAPEVSRQIDELSTSLPESLVTLQRQLASSRWGQWLVDRFSEADEWVSRRRALSQATTILSTTIGAIAGFAVVAALGLYLAAEPKVYREAFVSMVPPAHRDRALEVLLAIGEALNWWLIGKVIAMVLIGVLTWLGLRILGIPLALSLGVIAAVLTFIPNIGPILAVVPAALLALVDSPTRALYVVGLYFGIQTVESYLLTPLIQRRTIRLPPAFTLSFQLVFGAMLGALGIALATPLAAAMVVVVKKLYIEDTLEKPRETFEIA